MSRSPRVPSRVARAHGSAARSRLEPRDNREFHLSFWGGPLQVGHERQVEFAIAPGLKTRGDARLLRVALDNLLRNSWKYTAKRSGARVEFASVDANGGQAFAVRDNGAGFDMKYADKLFGVFQRLHSAAEFE